MPKRFPTEDPDIVMYADGTFYVRVGDRERSLRTKDFKVAQKRKWAMLEKLGRIGKASSVLRCGDVFGDYAKFRRTQKELPVINTFTGARRGRKTISAGTLKEIEDIWRLHLKSFWNEVRFDKVDEDKWVEYTEESTVIDLANHRKVFRGFLKWCKKKKYIKFVDDLPVPPVERRERHVLRPHEIRKLFEHSKGSLLLFVSMYLFMGMRRKEIMTLKWSDIHLPENYLVIRKSEVKTRKGRPLPINDFVATLLIARMADQKSKGVKTEFVFPNAKTPKRHADVSGLKTAWGTVMHKCGFPPGHITPHDLRATFEAYAHKANEFTDTQREKFAGASIDVQKKTYVRFNADDIRGLEAVVQVDGLEAILRNKTGKTRGEENSCLIQ
jgi:integrase